MDGGVTEMVGLREVGGGSWGAVEGDGGWERREARGGWGWCVAREIGVGEREGSGSRRHRCCGERELVSDDNNKKEKMKRRKRK